MKKKQQTIYNIKEFINNTPDPLIYWDELYKSLLNTISHNKLKELEKAYFNVMDDDSKKMYEKDTTFDKQ